MPTLKIVDAGRAPALAPGQNAAGAGGGAHAGAAVAPDCSFTKVFTTNVKDLQAKPYAILATCQTPDWAANGANAKAGLLVMEEAQIAPTVTVRSVDKDGFYALVHWPAMGGIGSVAGGGYNTAPRTTVIHWTVVEP